MSLNGQQFEKKQRPIAPAGLQVGVCYSIVDCGTHNVSFQGQPAKQTPLVHFSWEFPNLPFAVFKEGEQPKPLAIFQEYTVALGDKAKLAKMLQSWRLVPPVDLAKELPLFISQPCYINVVHVKDKQKPEITYANIGLNGLGIMNIAKETIPSLNIRPLTNPTMFFNLDNYSHEQYLKLPAFLQKKIASSLDWSGIVAKFGPPPQVQQTQQTQQQGLQNNQQFAGQQNQGFQQNTVFNQQQGFQQQNQPPVNNGGIITGTGNPFTDAPPF